MGDLNLNLGINFNIIIFVWPGQNCLEIYYEKTQKNTRHHQESTKYKYNNHY